MRLGSRWRRIGDKCEGLLRVLAGEVDLAQRPVLVSEQAERLGCKLTLPGREREVMHALGELELALAERPPRLDVGEEDERAIRILRLDQVQGRLQITNRGSGRMKCERSLRRLRERLPRRLAKRAFVSVGDPDERQCLEVVVREHLCPVLGAVRGQRLDPGGSA